MERRIWTGGWIDGRIGDVFMDEDRIGGGQDGYNYGGRLLGTSSWRRDTQATQATLARVAGLVLTRWIDCLLAASFPTLFSHTYLPVPRHRNHVIQEPVAGTTLQSEPIVEL